MKNEYIECSLITKLRQTHRLSQRMKRLLRVKTKRR